MVMREFKTLLLEWG